VGDVTARHCSRCWWPAHFSPLHMKRMQNLGLAITLKFRIIRIKFPWCGRARCRGSKTKGPATFTNRCQAAISFMLIRTGISSDQTQAAKSIDNERIAGMRQVVNCAAPGCADRPTIRRNASSSASSDATSYCIKLKNWHFLCHSTPPNRKSPVAVALAGVPAAGAVGHPSMAHRTDAAGRAHVPGEFGQRPFDAARQGSAAIQSTIV
jgi:hypothetical protein